MSIARPSSNHLDVCSTKVVSCMVEVERGESCLMEQGIGEEGGGREAYKIVGVNKDV